MWSRTSYKPEHVIEWLRSSNVFGFLPFCFGLLRRCGIWHQHRMEIDQSENVNTQMTNKETKHRWNTLTGNWGRSHSWGWTASSQPSTWDAKPVPNFCSKFLVDRPRGKQSHETINLNIFWPSALYCSSCPRDWESTVRPIGQATNWAPAAVGSVSEAKLAATWQKLPHRVAADSHRDNAGHETSVILGYKGRLCLI